MFGFDQYRVTPELPSSRPDGDAGGPGRDDRVRIFDTTLRDGEQSPGVSLTVQEKLEIARQLARLGVDVIEAGFPITTPGELEAVRTIAREVRGPIIAALARTDRRDIDTAHRALEGAPRARIHVFISTSPIHLEHMLRMTREQALRAAMELTRYARSLCADVEFSAQDATRSDPAFLVEIYAAAIEAGATTVNVPDTVGYTTPREFSRLIHTLRDRVPGIDGVVLSVHTHDDLGMAVANALAAVEAGAQQVECAINGIGERAGNCSLEEVVMALVTRKDHYKKRVGIHTEQLYRTSRLVANLTGMPVPPNKAVVGKNAFAHESGIHQDGVLKERTTYEIMRPEDVGMSGSAIVLGKHSGRHAFRARLLELGYRLGDEEFKKAFTRFKELTDKKKDVSDADLEAIVHDELVAAPELVRLEAFQVTSGNRTIPTATVRLVTAAGPRDESAVGDGPVDAVYRAIDKAVGRSHRLLDYQLKAVTAGKDAQGEVTVRVAPNGPERPAADDRAGSGRVYVGRGVSTDVLEASARAYVAALNKVLAETGWRPAPAAAGVAAGAAEMAAGVGAAAGGGVAPGAAASASGSPAAGGAG